ncbi:unknown [Mycoplasma sp. CAG:776]|nr:unknown [Mycoplasma sp. CAG:776]
MNVDYLQIKLKELKLFLEVKYKAKTSLDVERLYLSFLKEEIRMGTNYLNYEKDRDLYYLGNCYTYALGLPSQKEFIEKFIALGDDEVFPFNCGFTNTTKNYFLAQDAQGILKNFYDDCSILGIQIFDSEIDSPNYHNGYKIVLYLSFYHSVCNDFHFIRQNLGDGTWSDKIGYFGPIRKLEFPNPFSSHYQYFKTFEIVKPVIRERRK